MSLARCHFSNPQQEVPPYVSPHSNPVRLETDV